MNIKFLSQIAICGAVILFLVAYAHATTGTTPDGLQWTDSNGQITITGYSGSDQVLAIPDAINNLPVTSIGNNAFWMCRQLVNVTIPKSVTDIGHGSFAECSGLTSVTISGNVTSIPYEAFYSCSALKSVIVPKTVTSIGDDAFYACFELSSVLFLGDAPSMGSRVFTYTPDNFIIYYLSEANGFTSPTWYRYPAQVKSVTVPLVTINPTSHTVGLGAMVTLTAEAISDSAIYVQWQASPTGTAGEFIDIDNMENPSANTQTLILLDISLAQYGTAYRAVFTNTIGSSMTTAATLTVNPVENFTTTIADNKVTITGYVGSSQTIIIPSTINGLPVTSIGSSAFYESSNLLSVIIPDSITSIGDYAFYSCSGLTSLNIPSGVMSIGNQALEKCSSLTSITIPDSVTSIGIAAFSDCSGLTSVTISQNLTSIQWATFAQCSKLTSVTIPKSVTSIGSYAFVGCIGLTSVTIPSNVTSIGYGAFWDCIGMEVLTLSRGLATISDFAFTDCWRLTSLTIPNSVTTIGISAFDRCSGLTSVTIPSSVTSIGDSAFYRCSELANVLFIGNAPSLGATVFYRTAGNFKVSYLNSAAGFSSPTWHGYSALPIDSNATFVTWIATREIEAELSTPHADPDGDALPNLLEYALELDPLTPSDTSEKLIYSVVDDHLTVSFFRRIDTTEVNYTPEASSSLTGDWISGASTIETVSVTPLDNISEKVTVRDRLPLDGVARRFIRLRVDLATP